MGRRPVQGKGAGSGKGRQGNSRLRSINRNINFYREGMKSNARKVPTEVRCVKCMKLFVLPFRPRKPEVYCDTCYKKKTKQIKPSRSKPSACRQ